MSSQKASASLPGRGCSESGVETATGEVNCVLDISIENLAAFGERFDAIQSRGVADSRRGGDFYGALRGDFHFGFDDVFGPVAAAGGDVAGKSEIGERGHGYVVGAADAGFEHAAAPDGNGLIFAEIVDAAGGGVSADAAEFHIDDFAGSDFDRGAGVFDVVDTFVEADGSFELALEGGVGVDVVMAEGLLDHD